MVAQPSGSLGIVFEHAGAEYRNGWDAGAKRMFMRQLVDAGGETADGGRSPFAEAGADIARKKEAIAARLASADDRDGRFGEPFDAALHEQPVRRAFEVEHSGRTAGRTTKRWATAEERKSKRMNSNH